MAQSEAAPWHTFRHVPLDCLPDLDLGSYSLTRYVFIHLAAMTESKVVNKRKLPVAVEEENKRKLPPVVVEEDSSSEEESSEEDELRTPPAVMARRGQLKPSAPPLGADDLQFDQYKLSRHQAHYVRPASLC